MALQDVQVTINVAYPAPRIGLGRPLILTNKVGAATYKEYLSLDTPVTGVIADYASTTPTYKKAAAVFNQPNRPDMVAVATYDTDPAVTLTSFYNRAWHFVLVANDLSADQVKVATFMDAKDFKIGVYQVSASPARLALKTKKRTITFDNPNVNEHLDAAAVGNLASLPVGSITWKFKDVKGITPRYLTDAEIVAIDADNAIAYAVKAGKAQLTEGKLANGEYIDVIHGQDWVKADMENEVQNTLSQSPKVSYDAQGIGAIYAAITTTLQRGFNNGIIAKGADGLPLFSVTTLSRDQVDPADRSARIYRGASFEFKNAGAIHEAAIKGQITI